MKNTANTTLLLLFLMVRAYGFADLNYNFIPENPTENNNVIVHIDESYNNISRGILSSSFLIINDTIEVTIVSEECNVRYNTGGGCFAALDFDSCNINIGRLESGQYIFIINKTQEYSQSSFSEDTTYIDSILITKSSSINGVATKDKIESQQVSKMSKKYYSINGLEINPVPPKRGIYLFIDKKGLIRKKLF